MAALALWLSILPPRFAEASQICGTQKVLTFDGTVFTPPNGAGNYYGGYANISSHVPFLCIVPPFKQYSDSSVWVMLAGATVTAQYAQIGYASQAGDQTAYYFAEYKRDQNTLFVRQEFSAITGDQPHDYIVDYNISTTHLDMKLDGVTKLSTDFNPWGFWTTLIKPQWNGETHDPGDDLPGTVSNPTSFNSLKWKTLSTGSYGFVSSLVFKSGSPRYGISVPSSAQFNIWTN